MQRLKKVTVKPFLHVTDKPLGTGHHEDGTVTELYPLYYLITYNRKNQKLRSYYAEIMDSLQFEEEKTKELIAFESRVFEKIIRREADPDSGEFDMKGLKKKFAVYAMSLRQALSEHMTQKLRRVLQGTNDELVLVIDFTPRNDFLLLLEGAKRLFPNHKEFFTEELKRQINAYRLYDQLFPIPVWHYDFATVADWLDGSHQRQIEFKGKVGENLKALLDEVVDENYARIG